LGCEGFWPEFPQIKFFPDLPEKILGHFLCEHFLKQAFIWDDPQKTSSCAVVGLGLGGPEARLKGGASDDVIMISQP